MRLWNSISQAKKEITKEKLGTAVTIGNFDGVHRGHQMIIRRLVEFAQETKTLSVVLTFTNHTDSYLGERPFLLNQPSVRRELLFQQGLGAILEVEFNQELAKLSPELFFQKWLVDGLQSRAIIVGHDFRFGVKGSGDYHLLQKLGSAGQIVIKQIPPVVEKDEVISSSRIRQLIAEGNIEFANQMLGYPFNITGEVIKGEQRGRSLGFPTANIALSSEYLLPAYGVYLVSFSVEQQTYYGVASVGVKPTFGFYAPLIEVHLLDQSLDLYHKIAKVEFVKFIRPEMRFANAESLKEQISKDIETAKISLSQLI